MLSKRPIQRSPLAQDLGMVVIAATLALFFGTAATAQPPSSAAVLAKARRLAESHHFNRADALLSSLVHHQPQNAEAWQQLGAAQLQQHLYVESIHSYAQALKWQPSLTAAKSGEVHATIANALSLRASGHQNQALKCLMDGIHILPNSPELLTDFGIQAYQMKIYEAADKALAKAHHLNPSNLTALYALAHVELDEQHMQSAEMHLRAYLQARPDDASAHYGLGHLLHMMSRNNDAVSQLNRSIQLQPRQIASYYELGVIAMERRQSGQAQAEFTHVLALDPTHGGALTGMGILLFRAHHFKQSASYLSKAVHYAPGYVTAHSYYAMALAHLGQKARATEQMQQAQKLSAQQNSLRKGYLLKETH
jgi:tetratricopeptide (TPR) repeat protein